MIKILTALLKAKLTFKPIRKNKKSNRNEYADLESILLSVEPSLLENGIVISHTIDEMGLATSLYHVESGEFLVSVYPIKWEGLSAQQKGSEITYGRRYTLTGLLGVVADTDDDGEVATHRKPSAIIDKGESTATKPAIKELF